MKRFSVMILYSFAVALLLNAQQVDALGSSKSKSPEKGGGAKGGAAPSGNKKVDDELRQAKKDADKAEKEAEKAEKALKKARDDKERADKEAAAKLKKAEDDAAQAFEKEKAAIERLTSLNLRDMEGGTSAAPSTGDTHSDLRDMSAY